MIRRFLFCLAASAALTANAFTLINDSSVSASNGAYVAVPSTTITQRAYNRWVDLNWPTNISQSAVYATTNWVSDNFIDTNEIVQYATTNWSTNQIAMQLPRALVARLARNGSNQEISGSATAEVITNLPTAWMTMGPLGYTNVALVSVTTNSGAFQFNVPGYYDVTVVASFANQKAVADILKIDVQLVDTTNTTGGARVHCGLSTENNAVLTGNSIMRATASDLTRTYSAVVSSSYVNPVTNTALTVDVRLLGY